MDCQNAGETLVEPPIAVRELTARQFDGLEDEDMEEKLALEWTALLRLVQDEAGDYLS